VSREKGGVQMLDGVDGGLMALVEGVGGGWWTGFEEGWCVREVSVGRGEGEVEVEVEVECCGVWLCFVMTITKFQLAICMPLLNINPTTNP